MLNHNETVKFRVTRAIATCKHIPLDRDKRAHKVAGYMDTEFQREKNPKQVAQSMQDLQEEIRSLHEEIAQQRKYANEWILGWIRRKLW